MDIQHMLSSRMDDGEARAETLLLLEGMAGLTTADVLTGRDDELHEKEKEELLTAAQRVAQGEPLQHVVGWTRFCGLRIGVSPSVLIPRPETEELVEWVKNEAWRVESEENALSILDIGTGSGCIALALKRIFPKSTVVGVDLSEAALQVARHNAEMLALDVEFRKANVLEDSFLEGEKYDIIVSNPPYVCLSEQTDMEAQVLDHEPHTALFVSDDDPLLFYRTIARHGQHLLNDGGLLFFEINRCYGQEVTTLLRSMDYQDVELRQDQFGNDRMVFARFTKKVKSEK